MRANLILAISLISFAIILSGCTKEAERSFPRLLTLEATNISGEGATLNAMISNLKEDGLSPNCGFIIYSGGPSSLKTMGVLEAEPDMKTGSFHARAETGMKDGDEYWYTAFVDDGTTTVIGNVLSFRSRGGKAASIIEMEPKKGNLSDTVLLRLSGTIGGLSGLTVLFDNKAALIVDFINDELRVIVPSNLSIKENSVSITTGGTTNVFATKFELIVPEIIDFQPNEVYPGETVTINGVNFDPILSRNVVKFNGLTATVVSSTSTQLKVIAPNLEGVDCQISVALGARIGLADGLIKIKNLPVPVITDFAPAEAYPGEIVAINGLYFNTDPSLNTVKFNNTIAQIISSSFSQLQVIAPNLQGVECQISVTVGTRVGVANGLLKILNWPVYWTRMNDHPGGEIYRMGSFVIGDYGYTGLGSTVFHNYNLKFWRYNSTNDSWLEVAPFPGSTRVSPIGFAVGEKGYIVGGASLDNQSGVALRDVYEYNPGNNTWIQLANYPGTLQNNYIGWAEVVADRAFITFGSQDFYSYTPSTGIWTKLTNPPGQLFSHCSTFVIGNMIYVIGGIDNSISYKREVWAYNTSLNSWTRKNDFPGDLRRAGVGFGADGQYYFGLGIYGTSQVFKDLWRYDHQFDVWVRLPDYAGAARGATFCMVLNQRAYIGTGFLGTNSIAKDIYRFNPTGQ
jgi:N-acetylneuraminic acid mutarotase